jgi:hypothetical protein
MSIFTTRNDAKVRETTCGYAKCVDGINTSRRHTLREGNLKPLHDAGRCRTDRRGTWSAAPIDCGATACTASMILSPTRMSRSIARPSHRAASYAIAAVTPRFIHKSVQNIPRRRRPDPNQPCLVRQSFVVTSCSVTPTASGWRPPALLPRRMTLGPTGQPLSSERGQLARLRQADWNPERMVVQ